MNSKEKAEQLYIAYKKALNIKNDMRAGANPFAKQCALICVEEIKNLTDPILYLLDANDEEKGYWEQVKQEIEKL